MNTYRGISTIRWSSDSPDFTIDEVVESIAPDGTVNEPIIRTGLPFKGFVLFIVDTHSFKPDHEHCSCVHDRGDFPPHLGTGGCDPKEI
jgi:hypothetical protein